MLNRFELRAREVQHHQDVTLAKGAWGAEAIDQKKR